MLSEGTMDDSEVQIVQNGEEETGKTRKTLQQRLTDLIHCNIELENKSNIAAKAIDVLRSDHENAVKDIKCFYETEMCEARRLLNTQAEECARFGTFRCGFYPHGHVPSHTRGL